MALTTPLLRLSNVHKRFDAVVALGGVTFDVLAGTVHGVVGENGAGKSTLMNIIGGSLVSTEGAVSWEGEIVRFSSPADALTSGISIIHQELSLLPNLTVAENVYLGREPRRAGGLLLDRARMHADTAALLGRLNLQIAPTDLAGDLPIGLKQMVELAKALSFDSRLIIMDEPTSSLTSTERNRLLAIVEQLRDQGVAVLYISHRLDEILSATQTVTVLRDGEHVTTQPTSELTGTKLISLMVGRDIDTTAITRSVGDLPLALNVQGLEDEAGELHSIDLKVRCGEIVGLAGLIGAGRTAVAETLFGIRKAAKGTITVHDKPYQPSNPGAARAAGIALVPEDRRRQGLFLDMAIQDNVTITALGNLFSRFGVIRSGESKRTMNELRDRLQIKMTRPQAHAHTLSGGNQQKLVIGRWLAIDPSIVLLDEPTRGVDVGAKAEIRNVMRSLASEGKAILMISSDLPELLSLCDRILVLYKGRIVDEVDIADATEQRIVAAASGPVGS